MYLLMVKNHFRHNAAFADKKDSKQVNGQESWEWDDRVIDDFHCGRHPTRRGSREGQSVFKTVAAPRYFTFQIKNPTVFTKGGDYSYD